MHYNSLVLK